MSKNMRDLLRLDLQHFADKGEGEETHTSEENAEGNNEEHTQTGGNADEGTQGEEKVDDKRFTQSDIDRIVQERLARERKQQEEKEEALRKEEERKRLEENEEYKELAKSLQEQLDKQKETTINTQKESLLTQAGYSTEQVALLKDTVQGETADEIKESVEKLKAVIPAEKPYVDPSAGNGTKEKPSKKDGYDVGASAFERIKSKLR